MIALKTPKSYVRSLSLGWRFTLPAHIRQEQSLKEGTLLRLHAQDSTLVIEGAGASLDEETEMAERIERRESTCISAVEAYLGSGGKVVIPAQIRGILGWSIGERLSITSSDGRIVISTCCPRHRCRSCGSLAEVTEVIPNLYLCSRCLRDYAEKVRKKMKLNAG